MHKRQREVINYIVDQIKDITLIDTDPMMNKMFNTNVCFACLEAATRIIAFHEDDDVLVNKIKKFIREEIIPAMMVIEMDDPEGAAND